MSNSSTNMLQASEQMPIQIAHNMNPIEVNGLNPLQSLADGFNTMNTYIQNSTNGMLPNNQYQGAPDQGGGIDPRTLG